MGRSAEVFEKILGYQKSALMFYISQKPIEEQEILYKKFFKGISKELMELNRFISYNQFCYPYWNNISECIDHRHPKIKGHADLNLEDYLIGLNQRNRLAWRNVKPSFFNFVEDKVVLDFGCGGCFYTDIFSSMAKKVFAYDKPEVASFIKDVLLLRDGVVDIMDSSGFDNHTFDVIWVSEVIHGKSLQETKSLLKMLSTFLNKDGILIVNELLPGTPLSELFDIQMRIHTPGGKLYEIDEIKRLFKRVTLDIIGPYHQLIGGEL